MSLIPSFPKGQIFAKITPPLEIKDLAQIIIETATESPKAEIKPTPVQSPNVPKFDFLMFTKMSDIDCGSSICFEIEQFEESCPIYLGVPPSCDPPCILEGCTIEMQYDIVCKLWHCRNTSTTTTSPTPGPGPTPPTPSPSSGKG